MLSFGNAKNKRSRSWLWKIKPTSPSDCKLSQNDKTALFPKKYCCYEKHTSEFKCKAYDDLDFELLKDDECYNETNTNI